jgi:hypothetical protein
VKTVPILLAAAAMMQAADVPSYVFDNDVGRGALSVERQAGLAGKTGYAGIFGSLPS